MKMNGFGWFAVNLSFGNGHTAEYRSRFLFYPGRQRTSFNKFFNLAKIATVFMRGLFMTVIMVIIVVVIVAMGMAVLMLMRGVRKLMVMRMRLVLAVIIMMMILFQVHVELHAFDIGLLRAGNVQVVIVEFELVQLLV